MKRLTTILALIIAAASTLIHGQPKEMPPGLWEIKTKMDIAGMPKEMADKMGSMTMTQCIKPGQGKWTDQRGPNDKGEKKCEPTEMKSEGNKHSWKLKCADGTKGEGSVTHNGKDSYQMDLKMTSPRGSMNMMSTGKKIAETCEKK
jgi:hypothetical protein